jgi:hypothetical protein
VKTVAAAATAFSTRNLFMFPSPATIDHWTDFFERDRIW